MLKVSLTIAMFTAVISAGDMGNGGICTIDCPPPCTEDCGTAAASSTTDNAIGTAGAIGTVETTDTMFGFVEKYFGLY